MSVRWRGLAELVRAPAALSVPGDVPAGAAAGKQLAPRMSGPAAQFEALAAFVAGLQ